MAITRINTNQGASASTPRGHEVNVSPVTGVTIVLNTPFSDTKYGIWINAYTTINGEFASILYAITNKTTSGFKVIPSELCTVDWYAGADNNP